MNKTLRHGNGRFRKGVVTYDSLYRLARWIDDGNEEISEWSLFIDEAHKVTLARGFRPRGIMSLIDGAGLFGRVVGLTATPLPDEMFTLFATDKANRIEFVTDLIDVNFRYVESRDYVQICNDAHKRHKGNRHLCIIHVNDKAVGTILAVELTNVEELKDGKQSTILFNAETKDQAHHVAIVNESQMKQGVKNVIVTNSWNDGLSVNPEFDSYSLIITHHSRLIPEEMVQVASRIRRGKKFLAPSEVLVPKLEKASEKVDLSATSLNTKLIRQEVMLDTQIVRKALEVMRHEMLASGITEKSKTVRNLEKAVKLDGIRSGSTYNDPYIIDVTAIDFKVSNAYRHGLTTGGLIQDMTRNKYRFNFKFCGLLAVMDDSGVDLALTTKEVRAQKKKERQEAYDKLVTKVFKTKRTRIMEDDERVNVYQVVGEKPFTTELKWRTWGLLEPDIGQYS